MKNKFKKVVATGLAAASLVTAGGIAAKQVDKKIINRDKEYTVKSGDTLYDISNRYYGTGIYFEDLADYNHIKNPNEIRAGDVIKLPNKVSDSVQYKDQTYTVVSGDNLISICDKVYGDNSYDTALKLAAYNNISNPDKIVVGDVLNIPMYEELMNVNSVKR